MNIVQLREYIYTGIIKSVPQVVIPWTPVEYIKINATLQDKPLICKSSSKNLHIEIFFSEIREGLFKPVLNWLQTTLDFQKIKPFYDNDFNLKISIVHPIPRQCPENVNEFFLFQNFVCETPEMYFLYKWIEQLTSPKGTNEPIEYKFDKNERKEIYSPYPKNRKDRIPRSSLSHYLKRRLLGYSLFDSKQYIIFHKSRLNSSRVNPTCFMIFRNVPFATSR